MKVSSIATALSFASVFITSVFGVNIEWRVILDCGSSGTRARVYNYDADITPSDRIISEYTPSNKVDRDALSVKPGISTFVGKAGGVNTYLTPLVNQAARWVPPALLSSTTISAYGTAGMRFYSGDEQNDVWEAVIDVFTASPFVFGEAYTLSGDDEGVFGWLSTQYLLQQNKINITGNLGALDLGGASTQIVFKPTQNSIMQDNVRLVLDGVKTQLYSHSYIHEEFLIGRK
jgi:Golgi nucleoside diphosphatase